MRCCCFYRKGGSWQKKKDNKRFIGVSNTPSLELPSLPKEKKRRICTLLYKDRRFFLSSFFFFNVLRLHHAAETRSSNVGEQGSHNVLAVAALFFFWFYSRSGKLRLRCTLTSFACVLFCFLSMRVRVKLMLILHTLPFSNPIFLRFTKKKKRGAVYESSFWTWFAIHVFFLFEPQICNTN